MAQYECGFGKKSIVVTFHSYYALVSDTPKVIADHAQELCDVLTQRFEFTHAKTQATWSFDVSKVELLTVRKAYGISGGKVEESLTVPPELYFDVELEGRCALHSKGKASDPDIACEHIRTALLLATPECFMINQLEVTK